MYSKEVLLLFHLFYNCNLITKDQNLYVNMVIKKVVDGQSNPNIIKVKDLPKGNYKVTEKADWSWRYECYNVTVQRNDAEKYGDGTIISAVTPAPLKG